jgi:replicative DNA helicase
MSNEKRVPIAITAEAAALSLLAADPDLLSSIAWDASFFALDGHRAIFTAMERVMSRSGTCNAIAAISELETTGKLDFVGGRQGVLDILSTITLGPGPAGMEIALEYRNHLAKAKSFRDVLKIWDESEPDIRRMSADITELADQIAKTGTESLTPAKSVKEHLKDLIDDLELKTPLETFSTGIPALDHCFHGGVMRGEMFVVGADTGGGKSILLYQIALRALEAGKKVAIFSLEMPAKAILRRMACNMIGKRVETAREMTGIIDRQHIATPKELTSTLSKLMTMPLMIHDTLSEVGEIDAEARRLAMMGKADLIVVDYLQIVTMPKADSREQAISELARRLKLTALKTNCAVLTASQLNEDGRLRESRAIGHHADAVINIKPADKNADKSILSIDKNRRGGRGATIPVNMRGDISRFEEVVGQ